MWSSVASREPHTSSPIILYQLFLFTCISQRHSSCCHIITMVTGWVTMGSPKPQGHLFFTFSASFFFFSQDFPLVPGLDCKRKKVKKLCHKVSNFTNSATFITKFRLFFTQIPNFSHINLKETDFFDYHHHNASTPTQQPSVITFPLCLKVFFFLQAKVLKWLESGFATRNIREEVFFSPELFFLLNCADNTRRYLVMTSWRVWCWRIASWRTDCRV